MPSDPIFWLAAAPAVLIAGLSKGGFGGGAGFAATLLLALVSSPAAAAAVMLPILVVMDVAGLWAWRGKWDWRNARALMASGVVGIGLGALLFGSVDDAVLRLVIGALALLFVAWRAAGALGGGAAARPPAPFRAWSAAFWGALAGFVSFVAHAGGPPVAMHMLPQRPTKEVYQATTVLVFWWINLVKIPPYAALGLLNGENLTVSLVLAPLAPLGVMLGVWAHRRVSEVWYYRVIYVILTIVGARLVWTGWAAS